MWCVTGLPIYLLGEGMAGDDAFSLGGLVESLKPPTSSWDAFATWLVPTIMVFFPVLLLPLAVRRRPLQHPGDEEFRGQENSGDGEFRENSDDMA